MIQIHKILLILYLVVFASILPTQALDISRFEATCLDIGFKKKTEPFTDCVLELITRDKQEHLELLATKQKSYDQEQQYQNEVITRSNEQQNRELENRRIVEMQRRQIQTLENEAEAKLQRESIHSVLEAIGTIVTPQATQAPSSIYKQPENMKCETRVSPYGSRVETTCRKY